MIIHYILIFVFAASALVTLFVIIKMFVKKNKTEYEKLDFKYNLLLFIILLIFVDFTNGAIGHDGVLKMSLMVHRSKS